MVVTVVIMAISVPKNVMPITLEKIVKKCVVKHVTVATEKQAYAILDVNLVGEMCIVIKNAVQVITEKNVPVRADNV